MNSSIYTPEEVAQRKKNLEITVRALEDLNDAFSVDSATPALVRWAYWRTQSAIDQLNALGGVPKKGSVLLEIAPALRNGQFRTVVAPYVPGTKGARALTALEKLARTGAPLPAAKV